MLDRTFAALADPTRRAMLQRLAHGAATTGQLADLFPISRPAVSQHLRVLREAGLVEPLGTGRNAPNQLAPAQLFLVESWAHDLAERWTAAPPPRAAQHRPTSEQEHR
ncbi:ArsR/SmtB family transcription factor [Cellulomonas sp. ICMP 17802]|uniref:ArsR/SmtB family transcription factor n=1 Tax=Cellulomonas sp. ICMP 17802 TaxID=3239199 RepID=UPI00351B5252